MTMASSTAFVELGLIIQKIVINMRVKKIIETALKSKVGKHPLKAIETR